MVAEMKATTMLKDTLGWGVILWLLGYLLGVLLFAFAPTAFIGWIIMPVAIAITLWVLITRIGGASLPYYLGVAVVWTLLAIVLDYLFIVKLFAPADGYYKFDVYLYYALTFSLPLIVGFVKTQRRVTTRK